MTSALATPNAERPLDPAPEAAVPSDTIAPPHESGPPQSAPEGGSPPRESGVAPRQRFSSERTFAAQADDHVQLALAESVHAEANLNLLLRNARQLCSGLGAAGEAIVALGRELDASRELLAHSNAEQMALRSRVRMLEEALECARGDADRERALFIEQEDAFLAELLSDHARERGALEQRLASALERPAVPAFDEEGDPFPASADTSAESPAPESSSLRLGSVKLRSVYVPRSQPPSTPAPSADSASAPSADSASAETTGLELQTADAASSETTSSEMPSPDTMRPGRPASETLRSERHELSNTSSTLLPPPEARASLDTVPAPPLEASPPRSSKPPLRKKPDASTRPLIEYKLGSDDVAEERLGASSNPGTSAVRPKMP